MNCHGGVAEHGFRARRCDDELPGAICERIAQVPQMSLFGFRQHFEIRERGVQHWIPVDQALAAIDQSLFIQAHEDFGDCSRQPFVHREAIARPVDGIAEPAFLSRNRVTRLRLPLPHALDEGLAADFATMHAFGVELSLDDHLRRDARVIGARLPQRLVAFHAMQAGQGIHQRVLKRMAHVQRAGHIRRRNHDAVGLARCRCGANQPFSSQRW